MSLSVFCATRGEAHTPPFLHAMQDVADACHGSFVVVADGSSAFEYVDALSIADEIHLAVEGIHQTMETAIKYCPSNYVFCLDDDEVCTANLAQWLREERYVDADLWNIPRAWLYQDRQHYISSPKHWPNQALRIGRQRVVHVPREIHAGWLEGVGSRAACPYAIEHHKFLIRSLQDRYALVQQYEAVKEGAGLPRQYLPEHEFVDVSEWHG